MKNILFFFALILLGCTQEPAQTVVSPLEDAVRAYRARQNDLSPSAVLEWLKAGNDRFRTGSSIHGGYVKDARERIRVAASGQRPLAAILSCIDSRTSPEMAFDTSVGDLFTMRVAANVVNEDIIGSLEIAVESGARTIVVMGHTDCGGIKGACSNLELGHLTQLIARVKPAIQMAHAHLDADPALSQLVGERVVTNRRYIAEVSHANAQQSARQIRERSEILREKLDSQEITLISAVYNVDTGEVLFD